MFPKPHIQNKNGPVLDYLSWKFNQIQTKSIITVTQKKNETCETSYYLLLCCVGESTKGVRKLMRKFCSK